MVYKPSLRSAGLIPSQLMSYLVSVKKRTEPHPRNPAMGRASVAYVILSIIWHDAEKERERLKALFVGFLD